VALPWTTSGTLQFSSIEQAQQATSDIGLTSSPHRSSTPVIPPNHTPTPSPSISSHQSSPFVGSAGAYGDLLRPASPLVPAGLSRPRSLSRVPSLHQIGIQPWTKERQALFEAHIIRITTSNYLSFNWVHDWHWNEFLDEFIPEATHISRKVLAGHVLNSELKQVRSELKARANGKLVTLQSDGWTGGNLRHFQAFIITADEQVSNYKVRYLIAYLPTFQVICGQT